MLGSANLKVSLVIGVPVTEGKKTDFYMYENVVDHDFNAAP